MTEKKLKILIADDDKEIRSLLNEILSDEGYDVATASDGLEAIASIQKNDYDIILTDLVMPNADGLEVLKTSKSKNEDTLVIIITGFATTESAIEATKSGAYDHITKPFLIEEIKSLISRAGEFLFYKKKNKVLKNIIEVIEKETDLLQSELTVLRRDITNAKELNDSPTLAYKNGLIETMQRMSYVSLTYLQNYYEKKEKKIRELERLGNMWLNGEITDEKFWVEKEKILSSTD